MPSNTYVGEPHEKPMPPNIRKLFKQWLRMRPKRNLKALSAETGVDYQGLKKTAALYGWGRRGRDHDAMVDKDVLEMSAEATATARERQLRQIRRLIEELGLRITRRGFVGRLRPEDAVRALNIMVKLDRLTVGQSTENVQQRHEDALDALERND